MATWIVGGVVALLVAAIVIKMVRDKKAGKGQLQLRRRLRPVPQMPLTLL